MQDMQYMQNMWGAQGGGGGAALWFLLIILA